MSSKYKFSIAALILEVAIIVLYGGLTKYHEAASADNENEEEAQKQTNFFYPILQDINVMIIIGFGFLMVFLHKHSFSSVSFTFFISALAVQMYILWCCLWESVIKEHYEKIDVSYFEIICGLYCAGAILISYGALLGKITAFQFLILASIEVAVYTLNEVLLYDGIFATDIGGSIAIHLFGSCFGIAASIMISKRNKADKSDDFESTKSSDTWALIGTIFLWLFWPSFNASPS